MKSEELFTDHYHKPTKCDKCGLPLEYTGLGSYKCRKCNNVQYDDYGKARQYLDKHSQATAGQIAEATGVDQAAITRMIRDERLEVTKDSRVFVTCEACGKPIRSGMYCKECASIAQAAREKKKKKQELLDKKQLIQVLGKAMADGGDGKRRFER